MERQAEQTGGSTHAHRPAQVNQGRLRVTSGRPLDKPAPPAVFEHHKPVGESGHHPKPKRAVQPNVGGEERLQLHRARGDRDLRRHSLRGSKRAGGQPQRFEIRDQVGKFLVGQSTFQTFRHERDIAGALLLDVAFRDAHRQSDRALEFEGGFRRLLDDALKLFTRLGLNNRGSVTNGDARGGFENRPNQLAAREFVARGRQVRTGQAARAIHAVTFHARRLLFIREEQPASRRVALVAHGEIDVSAVRRRKRLGRRLGRRHRTARVKRDTQQPEPESHPKAGTDFNFNIHHDRETAEISAARIGGRQNSVRFFIWFGGV